MKARDRKIRRIAAVQARLHRIAEWQLMECQAKEQELQDRERRIIEGFNDEQQMPESAAQRQPEPEGRPSVEHGIIAKTKERLAAHALAEARKLKQALRWFTAAAGRAFRRKRSAFWRTRLKRQPTAGRGA